METASNSPGTPAPPANAVEVYAPAPKPAPRFRSLNRPKVEGRMGEQEEYQRLIRPFASLTFKAAQEKGRFKNPLFFEPPDEDVPKGDEFVIHLPDADRSVEFEEYTDENNVRRLRRRSHEEIERIVRTTTFKKAYSDERLSLEDLAPFRVRTAYRLTRELAEILDIVKADEALSDAARGDMMNPDPWRLPKEVELNVPGYNLPEKVVMHPHATAVIREAEGLPENECVQVTDPESGKLVTFRGVPLLPPPIPRKWLDEEGNPLDSYRPEDDRLLVAYCEVMDLISQKLYIDRGSADDADQGRYGLLGLLDPNWVRVCFPSKLQIVAWEQLLIHEAMQTSVDFGALKGRQMLIRKYGLQFFELETLWKLGTSLAVQLTNCTVEDVRAIMLLRLEEFVRRARESLDLKAELAGLKQIAIITGVSKEEKDDFFDHMMTSMRKIADERKQMKNVNILGTLPSASG